MTSVTLWVQNGELYGVNFANGNNTGFIEIPGIYVGLVEWTPRALAFGDTNKDGIIDSVDSAMILRMVVGG